MIRVRFAVSPVGYLYVSGGRVALANHLFARRFQGQMLLRLDDLDKERYPAALSEQTMHDLRWFGIDWYSCFHQSERLDLYRDTIETLKRDKLIYPCFESQEELKAKEAFRRKRNQSAIYDRAMLSLTARQRQGAEAGGKRPHWRFKLSGRTLEWNDLILGPRSASLSAVSDPIVVRSDGSPAPALASVIDDIAYGTTHIIRGEDNVGNTAVQIELFEILRNDRATIRFAHLPALTDVGAASPGGRKAATLTLRSLRHDGVEPSAIAACMFRPASNAEKVLSFADMAQRFELHYITASGFDISRMLIENGRVLSQLDFVAVADRLPGGATEAFWLAVRGSLDLLKEARGWWDVVAGTIVPPVIEGAHELLLVAAAVLPPEPWDKTVWATWIAALEHMSERGGEALEAPLRLALTGEDNGPALADLLPLIGRPRAANRLLIAAA